VQGCTCWQRQPFWQSKPLNFAAKVGDSDYSLCTGAVDTASHSVAAHLLTKPLLSM
jgi:hypothetical protein